MSYLRKLLTVLLIIVTVTAGFTVSAEGSLDAQRLDAAYTLALNAINNEDYTTAKEYLDICFVYCDKDSDPQMYADLLVKRACINVIEEKNDMALLSLDAALRLQPDLPDPYLVKAQVYAADGSLDAAIENLEKYIELSQDDAMYETVAQLYEARGDMESAQTAYEKFVAASGTEIEDAMFQTGLYRMENGLYEEAIQAFESYADDEVYAAGAMYNIGICRMNLGDYAGAAEAFDASVEKGGEFSGVYYNRGICYLLNAEWAKAAEDFTVSVEKEPYVDDARYNLAICQMQQEDYDAAIATFTTLIGDGDDAQAAPEQGYDGAFYYRAMCRAAVGEYEGAIADYTVCIEHGYDLASAYYQRAQVYAAIGDTEKQNSDLQNSLKNAG